MPAIAGAALCVFGRAIAPIPRLCPASPRKHPSIIVLAAACRFGLTPRCPRRSPPAGSGRGTVASWRSASPIRSSTTQRVPSRRQCCTRRSSLATRRISLSEGKLAIVIELAPAIVQRGRRRQDLDDQLRLGDVAARRVGRCAGHRQIELVEAVLPVRQPHTQLGEHAARWFEPATQLGAQIDDDRSVRLARGRHGHDLTAHQLVATIGAVVPAPGTPRPSSVSRQAPPSRPSSARAILTACRLASRGRSVPAEPCACPDLPAG